MEGFLFGFGVLIFLICLIFVVNWIVPRAFGWFALWQTKRNITIHEKIVDKAYSRVAELDTNKTALQIRDVCKKSLAHVRLGLNKAIVSYGYANILGYLMKMEDHEDSKKFFEHLQLLIDIFKDYKEKEANIKH